MSNYPSYTPYPQRPLGTPGQSAPTGKRGMPWWAWLLIIGGGVTLLMCGGVVAFISYIAAKGPDTKAYTGSELPAKYMTIVNELALLEPGEEIRFFYSDALTDIKDGFYFVSDRKVVVYIADAAVPATKVPFAKITAAEIDRSDSMLEDSTITLTLADDSVVSFPVSNEQDRDKLFHDTIQKSIKRAGTPAPPTTPRK
jgi:hypothetical protein